MEFLGGFPGLHLGSAAIPVADYVAFDLETTGLSPETDEILEVAMVRFAGGEPCERWSSLVNPGKPVPLKTLRLTHIDPVELLGSPAIGDLLGRIQEFRGSLPLVGHNSGFDAAFLSRKVQDFPGVPIYDTLELGRIAVPGLKSYKLADLARELGVTSAEAHRAYDDAEVSGVIFRLEQETVFSVPPGVRSKVLSLMGNEWSGARIFSFNWPSPARVAPEAPVVQAAGGSARDDTRQLSLFDEPLARPAAPVAGPVDRDMEPSLRALLDGEDPVASANVSLSGETARAVADAAARYADSSGKRLLLLGFPVEALPAGAGRAASPEDHLCLARLEEAARQGDEGMYRDLDGEQRRFLAGLFRWAEITRDGVLSELQMGSGGYAVAPEVSCPASLPCREACPQSASCFAMKGRAESAVSFASLDKGLKAARRADLVLVWGSQDISRAWQLGEPRVELNQLKDALKKAGVLQNVSSLPALTGKAATDLSSGGSASEETRRLAAGVADEVEAAAAAVRSSLEADLGDARTGFAADPPLVWRDLHIMERAAGDLRRFADGRSCDRAVSGGGAVVRVVEQGYGEDTPKGPVLATRAVWPAMMAVSALREASGGRVVLLSDVASAARASVGGRLASGLDLCPGAPLPVGAEAPSGGILVLAMDGGGLVSPAAYAGYLKSLLTGLALEVRKGFLAAFPSRALLKDTYYALAAGLEEQGVAVYGQGIDGGHRVVEHLLDEDAAVLAMAGGGPAPDDPVPDCLVLTRVPFAPPNPVDEARRKDIASRGGDGFVEVGVRPPALALRSHVEKMARSGKKCVIVLADPKLLPRRSNWGPQFLSAFGDLQVVTCPEREVIARAKRHLRG